MIVVDSVVEIESDDINELWESDVTEQQLALEELTEEKTKSTKTTDEYERLKKVMLITWVDFVPVRIFTVEKASWLAKSSCKKCCGRGYIRYNIPHRGSWLQSCPCVEKQSGF